MYRFYPQSIYDRLLAVSLLFYYTHSHFDIINWTVTTGGCCLLDHFHDIKALFHFTKYGVLAIEMWRTSNSRVNLQLLISQAITLNLTLSFRSEFILQLLQSCTVAFAAHLHNLVSMLLSQLIKGILNLLHLQLFGELAKLSFVVYLSPNDIEL